jgi:hypothetical protein
VRTIIWERLVQLAVFTCVTPARACLAGAEATAGPSTVVVAAAVEVSPLDPEGVPIAGCTSWAVVIPFITSYIETNIVISGNVATGWAAGSTVTKEAATKLYHRIGHWKANDKRDWKGNDAKEARLNACVVKLRTCIAKL